MPHHSQVIVSFTFFNTTHSLYNIFFLELHFFLVHDQPVEISAMAAGLDCR